MRPIATLVHDDPYLRMTPEARLAAFKERKARLFPVPPVIEATPAPLAIEPKKKIVAVETEEDRFRKWFEKWKAATPVLPEPENNGPDVRAIQVAICRYYGVTMLELRSARRDKQIVLPRQVGYYLSKKLTDRSLPDIGRRFNRDHTSALSGIRKIEAKRSRDDKLESDLHAIASSLGASLV